MIPEDRRFMLHQKDARDVLGECPKESVDLICTDPPYGKEWVSGWRTESFDQLQGDDAERTGVDEVIGECVRLVGQKRHLYVFGPADILEGHKVSKVTEIIWDKTRPGMGDLSAPWAPAHERISFAVSLHRHGGQVGKDLLPVRLRKGSVLVFPPKTGRKVRHPSEKPVGLMRELIESSTRQGDIVVDPFMGSGSTGVAAILTGRRFFGVEVNPDYFALAERRLAEAQTLWEEAQGI